MDTKHMGLIVATCENSNKKFYSKTGFRDHMKIHNEEFKVEYENCGNCGKRFLRDSRVQTNHSLAKYVRPDLNTAAIRKDIAVDQTVTNITALEFHGRNINSMHSSAAQYSCPN